MAASIAPRSRFANWETSENAGKALDDMARSGQLEREEKMIVCLGWGSLIWNPGALPIKGQWHSDGPHLPVEFARQSQDGRITLVLCERAPVVPVLWVGLSVQSLEEGRRVLADREGIPSRNIDRAVGSWSDAAKRTEHIFTEVQGWARPRAIKGVVWTALSSRFDGTSRTPTVDEVVDYLSGLKGDARARAEEYVRRAPIQIRTPYRDAIERSLLWTPIGDT